MGDRPALEAYDLFAILAVRPLDKPKSVEEAAGYEAWRLPDPEVTLQPLR